jgi:hypothetical protein
MTQHEPGCVRAFAMFLFEQREAKLRATPSSDAFLRVCDGILRDAEAACALTATAADGTMISDPDLDALLDDAMVLKLLDELPDLGDEEQKLFAERNLKTFCAGSKCTAATF